MAAAPSPKRCVVEILGRPEGGLGETRPVVVSPSPSLEARRDLAATLHELVDTLIELAAVDRTPPTSTENDSPLLLNAVEAGKLLSVSRAKVLELAARGDIPSVRVGGSVRIPRDRLTTWITDRANQAVTASPTRLPAWVHVDRSQER